LPRLVRFAILANPAAGASTSSAASLLHLPRAVKQTSVLRAEAGAKEPAG
jgi:hypothetical protein